MPLEPHHSLLSGCPVLKVVQERQSRYLGIGGDDVVKLLTPSGQIHSYIKSLVHFIADCTCDVLADPFLNDENFLLCVLSLEELGATGNKVFTSLRQ